MSANIIKTYSSKLGDKKGNKRIWLASKKLNETKLAENLRFEPFYDFENQRIVLRQGFTNKISVRKSNNLPIIDIINQNVNIIFKDFHHVIIKLYNDEIVIEPLKEEINQQKAKKKAYSKNPTAIEIFAGGGTLIKALRDSGIKTVAAVELEEKYLENLEINNPDIVTYCGDLAKLDASLLPDADIVVAGLPCEGYSPAQLKAKKFEAHPTGSLGFYLLKILGEIRPAVLLLEETANFQNSAMAAMTRYVLTSMGYHLTETILKGNEYGSLTNRKRYCLVASIKKGFKFNDAFKSTNTKTIGDILEIPLQDRQWLTKENSNSIAYNLIKEQEHIRKGEGFRMGRTYVDQTLVGTITKGIYQNRLTDLVLVNPDNHEMFSKFTPRELARINGLPEDFILSDNSMSTLGEIIGQGICYQPFNAVGKMIIEHLNSEEFDEVQYKLDLFKSTLKGSNNNDYTDNQLACFMTGSLF